MQFWNEIIHTALLGSGKKQVDPAALPSVLAELAQQIQTVTPDKEEQLLQVAALAFNYRQAGVTALVKEGLELSLAEAEEKPYCSTEAMQSLSTLISENNAFLLRTWLFLCHSKKQIVQPDALPALLEIARKEKTLRADILSITGKRAEWLGALNPEWKFGTAEKEEDLWQTGSPEQRRTLLQQLRHTDPDKARSLLEQTWATEDAASKLDLLHQLETGISDKDLAFLQGLSTEKGKKIKEEAISLLRKIPSSTLILDYWKTLDSMLSVKKESGLPGLGNKTALQLSAANPAAIKALPGIDALSNRKELTDDEFIAFQLMQYIPVSFYEQHWQLTIPDLIALFEKDELGKKLFPAFILSIVHFADQEKAIRFMENASIFYLDLIPLLPADLAERQTIKFFQQSPDKLIQYATQRKGEWSLPLASLVLQQAVKFPYQYTKPFFARIIHRIPVSAIGLLMELPPAETLHANYWAATREEIIRLLHLKQRIITAFNK